jgi:hypothetical protein
MRQSSTRGTTTARGANQRRALPIERCACLSGPWRHGRLASPPSCADLRPHAPVRRHCFGRRDSGSGLPGSRQSAREPLTRQGRSYDTSIMKASRLMRHQGRYFAAIPPTRLPSPERCRGANEPQLGPSSHAPEFGSVGARAAGPKAMSMLDLHDPSLDSVMLAEGMGVEATRTDTVRGLSEALKSAIAGSGPRLIETAL